MEERQEVTLHLHARTVVQPVKSVPATPPANEWSKVRKLALRHLNRFVSLEAKVLRGDDPDAIHDMRVASRRLQQALDLVFPKPLPREARRLRRKIRRCRRALGDVRNCDVLIGQVEARLARRHCSRREPWTAVKHHLQERRSENFARAIRKLSKVNMAVFYMRTKAVLDRFRPATENPPVQPPLAQLDGVAPEPFQPRLAETLVGVWNEFDKQLAASHRERTAPSIHAARIAAKRLRYLLEVVNQFGVAGSGEALAWLRKIQDQLGDWHDMEVLEEMIIEMLAKPEFLRDQLPLALATGKLILRNRASKLRLREKYFQVTLDSSRYQDVKNWAERLLPAPVEAGT